MNKVDLSKTEDALRTGNYEHVAEPVLKMIQDLMLVIDSKRKKCKCEDCTMYCSVSGK